MIELGSARLAEILKAGEGRTVMVVGDLMIDRYLWGAVTRISPEAPVPIINIEDDEVRPGGAANVANNLLGLKARPLLVGAVGEDSWADTFRKMLTEKGLSADGLIADPNRPTTVKTRIIGNNQHIARIDRERVVAISDAVTRSVLEFAANTVDSVDAIILQDYNKGVLVPDLIKGITDIARRAGKIVTVDPKFDNFFQFRNVTLFKPNRKETEEALMMRLDDETAIRSAGEILQERLKADNVLVTLSEKGMALRENNGEVSFAPTHAREVADVSGAGDTVIATVTFALAAGASMKEAVTLANIAAGIVCQEVGVVPIDVERLNTAG